jgi:hypothetical protein
MRLMISRSCMSRCAKCVSANMRFSPHRSHVTRSSQLGNAANGSSSASTPVGSIRAPVALWRLTSRHHPWPGVRSPETGPRPRCWWRRVLSWRQPDARACDGGRLGRWLPLSDCLIDGRRRWTWFRRGDDPHRNGNECLPLWRALSTVAGVNDGPKRSQFPSRPATKGRHTRRPFASLRRLLPGFDPALPRTASLL